RSHSFTLVPNRRTSPTGFWFASPIRTQTAKNRFPTSIPAHFSTFTSSMAPPFEERPTPSSSICLAGLKAPIGGSFYVGQTTFLTAWFPPFFNRPFLCYSARKILGNHDHETVHATNEMGTDTTDHQ